MKVESRDLAIDMCRVSMLVFLLLWSALHPCVSGSPQINSPAKLTFVDYSRRQFLGMCLWKATLFRTAIDRI